MNRRNFVKSLGMAGGAMALNGGMSQAALAQESSLNFKTKHVIWIINGNGSRKSEWYERKELSPNYQRLVDKGFVYEEDHNETTSDHGHSWTELLTGNRLQNGIPLYPTPPHYVRKAHGDKATNYWYVNGVSYYRQWRYNQKYWTAHPDFGEDTRPVSLTATQLYWPDMKRTPAQVAAEEFPDMDVNAAERKQLEEFVEMSYAKRYWEFNLKNQPIPRDPFIGDALGLAVIPDVLQTFKPKMILYQQVGHDTGHGNGGYLRQQTGYFEYEKVHKTTDEQLGKIIDFIENDPYFSQNTAIVVRPEFGRDDEVNMYGSVNHSTGYYQCHRSASIFWGPDFKHGKSQLLVDRKDMVPTMTSLFNVKAPNAIGQMRSHMFADHVGAVPEYKPWVVG